MAVAVPVAYSAWTYLGGAAIVAGVAGAYQYMAGHTRHAPRGPTEEDRKKAKQAKEELDKATREGEQFKQRIADLAATQASIEASARALTQRAEEERQREEAERWRQAAWIAAERLELEKQKELDAKQREWRRKLDAMGAEEKAKQQEWEASQRKKEAEKQNKEAMEREQEAKKQALKREQEIQALQVRCEEERKAVQKKMEQMQLEEKRTLEREKQQKEEFMQQLKEIELKEQEARDYPVPAFLEKEGRHVNIAVTGNSGVGKSSFINAIRRMKPNHPDAAKSGAVECTQVATKYAFPSEERVVTRISRSVVKSVKNAGKGFLGKAVGFAVARLTVPAEKIVEKTVDRSVDVDIGDKVCFEDGGRVLEGTLLEARPNGMWLLKLPEDKEKEVHENLFGAVFSGMNIWDLPGVGTTKQPQHEYLKKMGIRHFDMVLLVTGDRFTQGEVMLLHELMEFKVPFFLVRNKVDASIDSEMSEFAENNDFCKDDIPVEDQRRIANNILETVKKGIADEAKTLDFVYCISCLREHREKYDFLKLRGAITEALIVGREVRVASAASLGELISCVKSTYEDITGQQQSQEVMAGATDIMIEKSDHKRVLVAKEAEEVPKLGAIDQEAQKETSSMGKLGTQVNTVGKATEMATINFADFKTTKFSLQEILDDKATEEGEQTLKLDPANREKYLSDVEFQTVFGMGPDEFQKIPKWKRDKLKKERNLF